MTIQIELIENIRETTLPIIKLTKSINGKTGTATFVFVEPNIFHQFFHKDYLLKQVTLVCDQKKISTKDITLFFKNGKPYLLKTIFLFKNSGEWFDFLYFMNNYSKETGLVFEEK
jgi:photosystem II protein